MYLKCALANEKNERIGIRMHSKLKDVKSYFLMEHEGANLLKTMNLPVAESKLVKNEIEAASVAKNIGFPVALKVMSKDITHKTEADIVDLPINNEANLIKSYHKILKNAQNYNSNAQISGVLVQKLSPQGIELIFGIKRDAIFGHQLILGLGGTLVEIVNDFSIRMMPVSNEDINDMIQELKSYPVLRGYRNQEGINLEEIKNICHGLNKLISEYPDIAELDLNPVIFSANNAMICDVRILIEKVNGNPLSTRPLDAVEKMINPTSIAVIGASQNEEKSGGRLFRYIVENNFPGELYPVNPGVSEIKGYKTYPTLNKVPGIIDLACIIVAADKVPEVMRDCVEKGIRAVIIYSSGFSEVGKEGEMLQAEILEIANKGGIRVLGPNSIGVASPEKNIYTAFGSALESNNKVSGQIGFISQSGAMGSALLSRAWEQQVGFSRWISVANEADLSATDFIEVLAEDELTSVISVFMEGLKDVKSFERATKKALQEKKPVLIYKTGRSDAGKKAVQSHTGTIAGDDSVYSTAFNKFGALRVNQMQDLIDASMAFDVQPLPRGEKIGVLTASGGACSVIADLCSEKGIELPELKTTSNKIKNIIPPFGSAKNPVDVTAEVIGKPEMFKEVLKTLISDSNVDGIIIMLTTNADPGATVIAKAILDVFKQSSKPIVVGRMGAKSIASDAMKLYEESYFPVYSTPEKTVDIMHYLTAYNRLTSRKVYN